MPGVGTLAYGNTGKPYQATMLTPTGTAVPAREQSVTYTSYQRPNSITENGITATFAYNAGGDRVKMHVAQGTTALLTKYYIGKQYELDAQTNTERLYLGGVAYSSPAAYVKEAGNWKIYYLCRDYLGSITYIANSDGSLKAEYSYDAWGRLRNPATQVAYAAGSEPTLFLGRGYTGHEHLPWFGLINMNARLYDPVLGRFLSPDPYVQAPNFTQNFNRYSYCLNNPLVYVDETGELFVIDDWISGFFRGLVRGGPKDGWRTANKQAGNAAKIWGGLFTADKNKSFLGKVGEIFSRFTWQLPQTLGGFLGAHGTNMAGTAESVDYKYGSTVVKTEGEWGAITLGSYIIGDNTIEADANNPLFQHEYGHYLQSQSAGWAYLSRYGIPSLYSTLGKNTHDYNPVEQDANARAIKLLYNRTNGDFNWDFYENPIGVRENNWTMADYNTDEFEHALSVIRSRVKVGINDYVPWLFGLAGKAYLGYSGIRAGYWYDSNQFPYQRYSGRSSGKYRRSSIKY